MFTLSGPPQTGGKPPVASVTGPLRASPDRPRPVAAAAPVRPGPDSPVSPSATTCGAARRPTYRRAAVRRPPGPPSSPTTRAPRRPRPPPRRASGAAPAAAAVDLRPPPRSPSSPGRPHRAPPTAGSRRAARVSGASARDGDHVESRGRSELLGPAAHHRRPAPPQPAQASVRNATRRAIGSTRVTCRSGRARASTSPGSPAPEPRSATRAPSGTSGAEQPAVDQVPVPQPRHLARADQPPEDPLGRQQLGVPLAGRAAGTARTPR